MCEPADDDTVPRVEMLWASATHLTCLLRFNAIRGGCRMRTAGRGRSAIIRKILGRSRIIRSDLGNWKLVFV